MMSTHHCYVFTIFNSIGSLLPVTTPHSCRSFQITTICFTVMISKISFHQSSNASLLSCQFVCVIGTTPVRMDRGLGEKGKGN